MENSEKITKPIIFSMYIISKFFAVELSKIVF